MKIIISPAKKMRTDLDCLPWQDLPAFLPQAEQLAARLREMGYDELKKLWKCSDEIAAENVQRLHRLDLRRGLTPAILCYEGIQYQHMAPRVFTEQEYAYVQEHLRILSGFYGVLRPFDGVIPYRLEMQAKLKTCEANDLYSYWGDSLSRFVSEGTDCVIDLASREYSVCVSRHLPERVRFISCVFGEEKDGKVIEKGTMCKMARGEMVRYMAERQITEAEQLKSFDRLHYRFDEARSGEERFVFIKGKS